MSHLENLKKQIFHKLSVLENRIHQSDIFNTLKEKFQALSYKKQQTIKYSSLVLCLLCVFSIPLTYFYSSSDHLEEFKEKERLSLELLKTGGQSSPFPYQKASLQVKGILKDIVERYQKEEYSIVERGSLKKGDFNTNSQGMEVFCKAFEC